MSDWPVACCNPPHTVITSASRCCPLNEQLTTNTFANVVAWPAANRIIYIPFQLEIPVTVFKISWINGATVNGNIDVGIYDESKAKVQALGATAQAGASAIQVGDITDTVLLPGQYWMAMSSTSSTGIVFSTGFSARIAQSVGVQQEAGAGSLPTNATFANPASAVFPFMSLHLVSTV